MSQIEVPDWVVEHAAMAVERSHHPEWSDEQFSVWWNHDPFFCERRTTWNGYENMTRKEKALATARHSLTAALGAWVVPTACTEPWRIDYLSSYPRNTVEVSSMDTLSAGDMTLYTLRQEKPE